MTSLIVCLLGFLCLVRNAYAGNLLCPQSCQLPFNYLDFSGDPETTGAQYGMKCYNLLRAQSVYVCMRSRCTQGQIQGGLQYFVEECGGSIYSYSVIDNITEENESSWPQISYSDLSSSGNEDLQSYKTPVWVSDSLYHYSQKTLAQEYQADNHQKDYGYALYGFWGGVILIGFLNRMYAFVTMWLNRNRSEPQTCNNSTISKLTKYKERHITTPALFGYHCAHPLGFCTIPPRLQACTLMAYLIINVVLCAVSFHTMADNLTYPTKTKQILHFLGNRCGQMAITNVPILWIFAMRNDVLIWITGWSFTTYNQFHRWVARITTLEAVVHGILYTVFAFKQGGSSAYDAEWEKQFWWMGVISVCSMSLLCGLAIYPIRKHIYEFFLLFHITFAVLLLIALYFHVKVAEGHYHRYVWVCAGLWSFDRLCRILRIVSLNSFSRKSTATYNPDANTVTLDVPVRSWLRPQSGSYYFIYMIHGMKPWESHPFTMSSWTMPLWENTPNGVTTAGTGKIQNLSLSFIIRPHHSFTKRLRDLVITNNRNGQEDAAITSAGRIQSPVRILVEGPYGHTNTYELHHYKSVLFVIGGSGITVALAYFRALLDLLRQGRPVSITQINLVWAVRDPAMFLEAFGDELGALWREENSELRKAVKLHIDLYISSEFPTLSNSSSPSSPREVFNDAEEEKREEAGIIGHRLSHSSSGSSGSSSSSRTRSPHHNPTNGHKSPVNELSEKLSGGERGDLPQHVNIICHRPHIHEIIATEARAHATNGEKMAIVSCGPGRMIDDTRAAVVSALDQGYDGISFYPESFNW